MKMKKMILATLFFGLSSSIHAADTNFKHITIDGSFDDWAGVAPAYVDTAFVDDPTFADDPAKFDGVTDLKAVYAAHDDQYLYVRFTLYAPGNPFTSHNNIFVDSDNDSTTGFPAAGGLLGSEVLIQGGTGYQEKNGTFNDGSSVSGLDWLAAPSGTGTDFEFRISRAAQFDSDSTPVFTGDAISFVLEAENAQFNTVDIAPDTEGITYNFTPAPLASTNNSVLITLTNTAWRVNAAGSDLGTAWREVDYDDASNPGWTEGLGLFGFTPNPAIYPAPIQTPLNPGPTTYYFRTHFQWTNDPGSVILVASNYLSDGAAFYLNGSLVKNVRLPAGTNAFNTPATGGPATKGQAELSAFPASPLTMGDNLLAVEVHQTASDNTDLVFGNSLTAAAAFAVTITNPSLPEDRTVTAGNSTTFSAEYLGTGPLFFQWFKDNNSISNATNATLTIDPVLQGDAGNYTLKISNSLETNIATRSALLTVSGSPVVITDSAQPADQTISQGQPATFTVVASGSAPLSYQWFKGSLAIPDATNASFTIPAVQASDAGDYHAVVANPLPSSASSRNAHLTVTLDTTPPTINSAAATPNKITITFSEPVTEASVTNLTAYSLSGGLHVLSAARDPNNSAAVVLVTDAQTIGANYTLAVKGVTDRFNNVIASNTAATVKSSLVIDGSFEDWASVPLALTDAQDTSDSTDYKDVYVASDDDFIYMRVTLYTPSDITIFYNNIFIDADNDPTTGFAVRGIGSEMLIQGGAGYQEKNRGFNEGAINGLDWSIAPTGSAADFEFRFSRHATYAGDGLPVFTGDTISFIFESENTGFVTKDTAPDTGGFSYTFAASSQLGPLAIALANGKVTISWAGPGKLQSRQSLSTGTWEDIPDAPSGYTVSASASETYYRLTH
jgi:hypothetical protein